MFFSSQPNGNCLLSSLSILLVGNSILVDKLRVMLSLELFLNSNFYASHPFIENLHNSNKHLFSKLKSVFFLTLSHKTSDLSGKELSKVTDAELVKQEALSMCQDKVWCSLMCVLSLPSVLQQTIELHYPDFGCGQIPFCQGKHMIIQKRFFLLS